MFIDMSILPQPRELAPEPGRHGILLPGARACSSRNAANITRTIFGSSSPRCASVNGATLWTMGAAARKIQALELGLVHRAGLRLEPGGLEQLAHTGGDDAVKLAGIEVRTHRGPRALRQFCSTQQLGHRYAKGLGELHDHLRPYILNRPGLKLVNEPLCHLGLRGQHPLAHTLRFP